MNPSVSPASFAISVRHRLGKPFKDIEPTDHIFIRLFKSYEYVEHFELSVPNESIDPVEHEGYSPELLTG